MPVPSIAMGGEGHCTRRAVRAVCGARGANTKPKFFSLGEARTPVHTLARRAHATRKTTTPYRRCAASAALRTGLASGSTSVPRFPLPASRCTLHACTHSHAHACTMSAPLHCPSTSVGTLAHALTRHNSASPHAHRPPQTIVSHRTPECRSQNVPPRANVRPRVCRAHTRSASRPCASHRTRTHGGWCRASVLGSRRRSGQSP